MTILTAATIPRHNLATTWASRERRRRGRYFFVPKSTFGVFISSAGMSNVAISFDVG